MIKHTSLLFLLILSMPSPAKERTVEGVKYVDEKIFEGSDVIWGMDFITNDQMIFTERNGKVKILDLKTKNVHEVSGVPKVFAEDQGGMLDVFYDQKDKDLYLTYSDPDAPKPTTSLYRGKLSGDLKTLKGSRLFQGNAYEKGGIHFGSRVLIDKNQHIYLSIGERNKRDMSQLLTNHQGKILRLTKEGKAVSDNPFVSSKNALPEIWTYGHRNPQGLALNSAGEIYNAEMGPRGGDELNFIQKGANYGWPEITYGREYYGPKIGTTEKPGMEQPVIYWVPSINPSGITFYQGKNFAPLQDNLLMAALSGHVRRLVIKNQKIIKEEKMLEDLAERFRQVKAGLDGNIYVSTDSGKIIRLKPL